MFLRGLVTDAAKDEMEPSSCPLVTKPNLMLSTTPPFGTKGNSLILKKSGPLTQLMDYKTSAEIARQPASAEFSQVATWFPWSRLLFSRISLTRFARKIGCLFVEFIHCKTMVLSLHINI